MVLVRICSCDWFDYLFLIGVVIVSTSVYFVIPGAPVGKGRPRFARRGNFVSTFTPEKTAIYENLVKVKAQEAMSGRQMIEGPVKVSLRIVFTTPSRWSQKKKREAIDGLILPISKPDIDNVLKGIMDACNKIVFKDDNQAVEVHVAKRYSETPCVHVQVSEINESQCE